VHLANSSEEILHYYNIIIMFQLFRNEHVKLPSNFSFHGTSPCPVGFARLVLLSLCGSVELFA